MDRTAYERRLRATGTSLYQAAKDMGLSTGTPSRWRTTGVPRYAVAYLVAIEAMDDAGRAEYRSKVERSHGG